MSKLTDKQEMFCQEYVADADLNATRAAIKAGYSESTAQQIGSENLLKPVIKARISELQESRLKRIGLTQDEVLVELKNFAFSDITETITLTVEQIKELPPEVRRLITQYKKVTRKILGGEGKDSETLVEETIELKFIDKMKAFEMLNRHIGFYEKDNSQKDKIVISIEDRNDRMKALEDKMKKDA